MVTLEKRTDDDDGDENLKITTKDDLTTLESREIGLIDSGGRNERWRGGLEIVRIYFIEN